MKTADGVVELRARGMPLGLMPGMEYEEKEIVLEPGDSVLLHTDGIVEAHDPEREMFGFPRLKQTVAGRPAVRADRLVLADLSRFAGPDGEQEDDITMVALRARPPGAAPERCLLAEFELASEPGGEREAIDRVAPRCVGLGLAPARLERLATAVAEATMNAMEHGNGYDADLPVASASSRDRPAARPGHRPRRRGRAATPRRPTSRPSSRGARRRAAGVCS